MAHHHPSTASRGGFLKSSRLDTPSDAPRCSTEACGKLLWACVSLSAGRCAECRVKGYAAMQLEPLKELELQLQQQAQALEAHQAYLYAAEVFAEARLVTLAISRLLEVRHG